MESVKPASGKVKIVNVKKPVLEALGAIIKVEGCGLCGSDIVKIREGIEGAVLGHEIVGEIVEIRSGTLLKTGDRVVVAHHYSCFECEFCANESYSMCQTFKSSNVYPAGFSEFISITEGHLKHSVFKLPEGFDPVSASFMEPLACCLRALRRADMTNAVRRVGLKSESTTLVLGLGSIGILMVQALKSYGHNSHGFDIKPKRQKGFDFDKNIKYDTIFMTSGSAKAISKALSLVKDGGKIIVFSSVEDESCYTNNEIYYRELSIIGSYSPAPIDLKTAHSKILNREIRLDGISTIYPLKDIRKAVDDTLSGKIYKAYIKI